MRIACVLDVDYLKAGKELKGKKGEVTTKAEAGIDEVRPDQFDALFIKC